MGENIWVHHVSKHLLRLRNQQSHTTHITTFPKLHKPLGPKTSMAPPKNEGASSKNNTRTRGSRPLSGPVKEIPGVKPLWYDRSIDPNHEQQWHRYYEGLTGAQSNVGDAAERLSQDMNSLTRMHSDPNLPLQNATSQIGNG